MSQNIFSGDTWSTDELKGMLRKLEDMYARGIRESSYAGQQLSFASTTELEVRIGRIRAELDARTNTANSKKSKKVVRVSTTSKGFGKGLRGTGGDQ
jgi:hypothetical protein